MVVVEDLVFTRRDGDTTRTILNRAHFTIAEHEQVAIIGDSGSGKTTLINLLGGLLRPDSGKIWVAGKNIAQLNDTEQAIYRRSVGMVFQHYQLLSPLTVRDNITFQAQLNHRQPSHDDVLSLTERLGITDKLDVYPHQLSGGEQQRVGIARALLNRPALLLADEPTGNLDAKRSEEVVALMQSLCREQGINLIMVTHSQQLAHVLDRQILIQDQVAHG